MGEEMFKLTYGVKTLCSTYLLHHSQLVCLAEQAWMPSDLKAGVLLSLWFPKLCQSLQKLVLTIGITIMTIKAGVRLVPGAIDTVTTNVKSEV